MKLTTAAERAKEWMDCEIRPTDYNSLLEGLTELLDQHVEAFRERAAKVVRNRDDAAAIRALP